MFVEPVRKSCIWPASFPKDLAKEASELLSKTMQPGYFVISGKIPYQVGFELSCAAALRGTVAGTRNVVVVPFQDAARYVRDLGTTAELGKPLNTTATLSYLKSASQDQISEMARSGKVKFFSGTLGPTDVVYVPAGCIVAEKPQAKLVYGVRLSFAVGKDSRASQELQVTHPDH